MTVTHSAVSTKELSLQKNLGVVIQSNHLQHLIEELKKRVNKTKPQKIAVLVENSAIKNFLQKNLDSYAGLDFTEPAQFDPLLRYVIDKELADVFHLYAKFGHEALEEWLEQASLEASLYKQHVRRSVPIRATQVHLFHPTYLPKWYLDPLLRRSKGIDLFIYILSPSPLFLLDLVQEKHLLQDRLNGAYLEDQYRLLAHLIPYKLPLLKSAEFFAQSTVDGYIEPTGASSLIDLKKNLFHQKNILLHQDATLAVIAAKTRLEEVENCFHYIYTLLQTHPCISPSDVTIFADLKEYAPILEIVFADKIALQIDQVSYARFDPSIKNFLRLFELIEGVWTLVKLKPLFLSDELAEWLEYAGFSCGFDNAHQKNTLKVHEATGKSFMEVFDHLIASALSSAEERVAIFPISLVQPLITTKEQLESLHAASQMIRSLQAPLENWFIVLKEFFLKFLPFTERHPFFDEWNSYQPLMDATVRDFPFIRQLFYDLFDSMKGPLLLNEGDRVIASNLKEGAILPNRVFYVLGMGIDQFPSYKELSCLYCLKRYPPPQGLIDRYRFLELILHADERLICSYSSSAPSTILEEIFRNV
jgi:exonuclease V gamma subunit